MAIQSARDRLLLLSLILVALTAITFWRVRSHDFLSYDDNINVYQNPRLLYPEQTDPLAVWKKPYLDLYIPITYSVWDVIASVGRITPDPNNPNAPSPSRLTKSFDPSLFHSANIAIHVANVLLVFTLLRLVLAGASGRESTHVESTSVEDIAAACGALLFGLHPIQVEAVAWVTGLKDLLGGFFSLLALWLYALHAQEARRASAENIAGEKEEAHSEAKALNESLANEGAPNENSVNENSPAALDGKSQDRRWWFFAAATLSFVFAMLSKPSAVSLPLAAGVIDFALRRSFRASLGTMVFWIALALPVVWVSRGAQPVRELFSPLWARPLIALDAISFYLQKIIWPLALRPEYSRTPRAVFESGAIYWTWLVPAAIGVLVWWKSKAWGRLPITGGLLFVAILFPALGFVPFAFQYYSTVADRYVYTAMLGAALILAWILSRIKRREIFVVAVVVLAASGALTAQQSRFWRDSETLYRYTMKINPRSWQARVNLALIHEERGEIARAEQLYREAIRLQPTFPEPYNNLGRLFKRRGQLAEAVDLFVKASKISPTFPQTYYNLGQTYIQLGQPKYAILAFRRHAELEPQSLATYYLLAELYLRQKQWQEADIALQKAQRLAANPLSFHLTVAVLLTRLNLLTASVPHYAQALQYRPLDVKLHNDLGATLLRLRRASQAEKAFRNALKVKPDYAEAHNNLALALLAQKKNKEAIAHLRRALQLNPKYKQARENLQAALRGKAPLGASSQKQAQQKQ